MRHYFTPQFEKSYRKLSSDQQELVDSAIENLLAYFSQRKDLPKGLGLKRLTKRYWEIRSSLDMRIIFEAEDPIGFLLVGNHDDIRRFIKQK